MEEYNYCLRCGRKLKTIEARQIGYGKICLKKIQSAKKKDKFNKLFGGYNAESITPIHK